MNKKYDIPANMQIIIYAILLYIYIIMALNVLFSNRDRLFVISLYLGAYLTISAVRHVFVKKKNLRYILAIVELSLILSLVFIQHSEDTLFLLLVVSADLVTGFSYIFSVISSAVMYICFIVSNAASASFASSDDMISYVFSRIGVFVLVFLIMLFSKRQAIQSMKMKDLLGELREKSAKLEEMAIVKERNRIAGEIHDTVGHTLTAALISLEAGKMLIDRDNAKAKEKIEAARLQLKKGLEQVRSSVKAIREENMLLGFEESFKAVLKQMEKDMNISFVSRTELNIKPMPFQYHVLLRILQESVTNGIKHGGADKFTVELVNDEKNIHMRIHDNGAGSEKIIKGFGLANMEERVKELGGSIEFQSEPGNGFKTSVNIPLGNEVE